MTPLDITLSFLISYIANCLPTSWSGNHKSINDCLEKCFKKAVEKWTNNQETQINIGSQMSKYLPHLRDYIANKKHGRHPCENELLRLWAEEILNDKDCCTYILSEENKAFLSKLERHDQLIADILQEKDRIRSSLQTLNGYLKKTVTHGIVSCQKFWEQWSTGPDNINLNFDIVLAGRDDVINQLLEKCQNYGCIYIEAISTTEAIAFSVATLLRESDSLTNRAVVATERSTYIDFIETCKDLIIITDIADGADYVASKGHTVIVCTCPAVKNPHITQTKLPAIAKEGFISSLCRSGFDEHQARLYAKDTVHDVNILRHILGFSKTTPEWMQTDYIQLLVPSVLIGEWSEEFEGDRNLVGEIANMEYSDFISKITPLLYVNNAPLIKIGSIWKVKAPYDLMMILNKYITDTQLDIFEEVVEWIMLDDDPDAIEKLTTTSFKWWRYKKVFSTSIQRGVFQGLTLYAIIQEKLGKDSGWVDNVISKTLSTFTLEQFLSHRYNLLLIAEAAPKAFIKFIKNDIGSGSAILREIMPIRHKDTFLGTEINYAELLFALEALSWDKNYLRDTTEILMILSTYPNDGTYANSPINSLSEIYCFRLPQTYCSFQYRLQVLQSLASKFPVQVSHICLMMLNGLKKTTFYPSVHFQWRLRDKVHTPILSPVYTQDILDITNLMLENLNVSAENLWDIIEVSFCDNLSCIRRHLLDTVKKHINELKGDEDFVEKLRAKICHYRRYKNKKWGMDQNDLALYEKLLKIIESDNFIDRNLHYFAKNWIPEVRENYDFHNEEKIKGKEIEIRASIIRSIIDNDGLDSVWSFSKKVKSPIGIAEALYELYQDSIASDVYCHLCSGDIDVTLAKPYYWCVYKHKGEDVYVQMTKLLSRHSLKYISIVLCAPGLNYTLASKAQSYSLEIEREYWKNIAIWTYDELDLPSIYKLCRVGRYKEVLNILCHNKFEIITTELKSSIIMVLCKNNRYDILVDEIYCVAKILESIPIPTDEEERMLILRMELLLFDNLENEMPARNLHLVQAVNTDPQFALELIQLVYRADEDNESLPVDEKKQKIRNLFAIKCFHFFFHYDSVPYMNETGIIDETRLSSYLNDLHEAAYEINYKKASEIFIGRIIGNFPENGTYPSDFMCQLVESFNSDIIDSEISRALSNRRGFTARSPYEGGTIERNHIKRFTEYSDRSRLRSPRLTEIFENKIIEYKEKAEKEDQKAKLNDLLD